MKQNHNRSIYSRQPRKNARRVTVPAHVGPYVRLFFSEMARQGLRYQDVEDVSGVLRASQKAWRKKNTPSLSSLQAVLNTLGFDLLAVPAIEILPPELAGELATIASKMKAGIPEAWSALIEIGIEQRDQREHAHARFAEMDAERADHATVKPKQRPAV
jgi:transcriptional regulator with XRE-family HTH domain